MKDIIKEYRETCCQPYNNKYSIPEYYCEISENFWLKKQKKQREDIIKSSLKILDKARQDMIDLKNETNTNTKD